MKFEQRSKTIINMDLYHTLTFILEITAHCSQQWFKAMRFHSNQVCTNQTTEKHLKHPILWQPTGSDKPVSNCSNPNDSPSLSPSLPLLFITFKRLTTPLPYMITICWMLPEALNSETEGKNRNLSQKNNTVVVVLHQQYSKHHSYHFGATKDQYELQT